jgi:hypothetical protein
MVVGLFDDPVTLRDGRWEGEPYVAGGASRPTAGVIDDLLWSATGGSGTRNHVAVFTHNGTGVSSVSAALIGDRVKLREARIVQGRIEIDVVQHGPDDAMCCPSVDATRVWLYDGEQLRETTY